ncbi:MULTISPECIES: PQQ-dependent sugar dehydrogenase [Methylotenera]|uniref:PQQ-dependent sugar dehydrogenase n=1 Tax=Methylotenera TaxID=359407 RepID=UPI000382DE29|nr:MULTISPECIES: sorbosone dehydrogenase family protein [Methylotenera]
MQNNHFSEHTHKSVLFVPKLLAVVIASAVLALSACSSDVKSDTKNGSLVGFGPNPTLDAPNKKLIPTVNIAPAIGWPDKAKPTVAAGLSVAAFAQGLDHPRWLYVLPNGDVLVAETNGPPKGDTGFGITKQIRGWIMGKVMTKAGAGVPSANRIMLLRDTDNDGVADVNTVLLDGLMSPFGMALVGDELYVANADAVVKFPYKEGDLKITAPGTKVVDLPGGPINHHWTKNIIANKDGTKLYVTVGSNSNVAEDGMEVEVGRATIWEVDIKTGKHRLFAEGLRNPNGLTWEPETGALWTVVNERDELGDDLVPDYLTSVQDGAFYGWPYSYYGQNVDERVQPQRPELVAKAISPDYALGAHTASLGLVSSANAKLSPTFTNGMFIGQHGSWNRKPASGYKVIYVPFVEGKPAGTPIDVLTGFLSPAGEAYGRPVGVAIDNKGALLVADDVGNKVWRVMADAGKTAEVAK